MASAVESNQAWLEFITYQMNVMNWEAQQKYLAGPIALLKYNVTRAIHTITDEAQQLFGGRAITRTGMGQVCHEYECFRINLC
jgi:alkylation response protein AidB-like acyl-CoA dehydrogenase